MQFTPQQLAGAGRFNSNTRIGNWNEDAILEEYRMKEYRLRKRNGNLASSTQQQKYIISGQHVPHSYSVDGIARFGNYINLSHEGTGGTLACDVWEETMPGSAEYILSVSQPIAAVARNTFKIVPVKNQDEGNVLNYGDSFRLMANESLRVDANTSVLQPMLYLKSCLKNDRQASPISGNQEVSMSKECDANTIWHMTRGDVAGAEQYLAAGKPVQASHTVILVHAMTRQQLSADPKFPLTTDFGNETEVCCFSTKKPGKCHNLVGEAAGARTGETLGAPSLPQNSWKVVFSTTPEEADDVRELPVQATYDALLSLVQEWCKQTGRDSIRKLHQSLSKMEDNGNGQLDREDFKWALIDFGLTTLSDAHLDTLLTPFDTNGWIRTFDFIDILRGEVSESRLMLIHQTYDSLDAQENGQVSMQLIATRYDTSFDVRSGGNEEDLRALFLSSWNTKVRRFNSSKRKIQLNVQLCRKKWVSSLEQSLSNTTKMYQQRLIQRTTLTK